MRGRHSSGQAIELRTDPARHIDVFPDLSGSATVMGMLVYLTVQSWATDPMRLAFLAVAAVIGAGYWRRNLRARSVLQVNADGLWPRGRAFIPAERFEGVAVRRWARARQPDVPSWYGLSVQLDDGREVCVPAVARAVDAADVPALSELGRRLIARRIGPERGHSGDGTILVRRWNGAAWSAWQPLIDDDGRPLHWTARNDLDVQARIDAVIREALASAEIERDREPRALGNLVGPRSGTGKAMWMYLGSGDRYVYRPITPPAPNAAPADEAEAA